MRMKSEGETARYRVKWTVPGRDEVIAPRHNYRSPLEAFTYADTIGNVPMPEGRPIVWVERNDGVRIERDGRPPAAVSAPH